MPDISKSPWAKPQDAPATPQPQPPHRHPHLNYDDPVMTADSDDSDWLEGWVEGFPERVDALIRTGRPGPGVAEAFDKMMRHDRAEWEREMHSAPVMRCASFAQIKNPDFWRGLFPFTEGTIDVEGMLFLKFTNDSDTTRMMRVTSHFPEDLNAEYFTAYGSTPEALAADLTSELARWCRIAKKPFTV